MNWSMGVGVCIRGGVFRGGWLMYVCCVGRCRFRIILCLGLYLTVTDVRTVKSTFADF